MVELGKVISIPQCHHHYKVPISLKYYENFNSSVKISKQCLEHGCHASNTVNIIIRDITVYYYR